MSSALTRFLLSVALVSGLIVATAASHGSLYLQGRLAERNVQEQRRAEALRRAAEEAERIRDQDLAILMGARDRETIFRERIREVRIDVPTPDCRDLGADWLQQANQALATTRSRDPPAGL